MESKTNTGAAIELADALEVETYYGFNLRIVLAEAAPEERAVIQQLVDRARAGRNGGRILWQDNELNHS